MAGVGGTRDAIYSNVWKWSKIPLSRYFKCRFWVMALGDDWIGWSDWLELQWLQVRWVSSLNALVCMETWNVSVATILRHKQLFYLSFRPMSKRVMDVFTVIHPSHIQHPTPHIEAASSIHRLIDSFDIILQRVSALWANCSVPFRQSAIHCLHAALSLAWIDSIVRLVTNMNSNKATVDVQSSQCDATQRSSLVRCQRSLSL